MRFRWWTVGLATLLGGIILAASGWAAGSHAIRKVVIGGGHINGYRYHAIAESEPQAASGAPCIFLHVSELHGAARRGGEVGQCLTEDAAHLPEHALRPFFYGASAKLLPDAELVMQGLAGTGVASMKLRYEDNSGAVHHLAPSVFKMTRELGHRIGTHKKARFFVGFLPQGTFPPGKEHHHQLSDAITKRVFSNMRLKAFDGHGRLVWDHNLGPKHFWRFLPYSPPPGYTSPYP